MRSSRVRRTRLAGAVVTAGLAGLLAVGSAVGGPVAAGSGMRADCPDPDPAVPKYQFRAPWIASVENIDWPSQQGLPAEQQQAEYVDYLDHMRARRMNAAVVQIRPTADAFWPSPYEPWSHWLTGTQGEDPGYDPLMFMLRETHARDME